MAGGVEAAATVRSQFHVHSIFVISQSKMCDQYPFEFAKTRVQLRNEVGVSVPRNPFLVVANVFRQEGVRALYKGCSSLIVVGVTGSQSQHLTRRPNIARERLPYHFSTSNVSAYLHYLRARLRRTAFAFSHSIRSSPCSLIQRRERFLLLVVFSQVCLPA